MHIVFGKNKTWRWAGEITAGNVARGENRILYMILDKDCMAEEKVDSDGVNMVPVVNLQSAQVGWVNHRKRLAVIGAKLVVDDEE